MRFFHGSADVVELAAALALDLARYLAWQTRGLGALALRVREDVHVPKADRLHERHGLGPLRVALAGEADDHVRGHGEIGDGCARLRDQGRVRAGAAPPGHAPEHRVRAALQRQVQMRRDPG